MNEPNSKDLRVGDRLYLVSLDYRSDRDVVITKVGRKYLTVSLVGK